MRSVSGAMARIVLPGAQTVRGRTLTDYKANIRRSQAFGGAGHSGKQPLHCLYEK